MDNPRPKVGFGVMLLKNNKILLGHRHTDPEKAKNELHEEGTWTMPGGKLEYQEKLYEGVCREVLEECNITVDPKKLKLISIADDILPEHHYVTVVFLAETFSGEAKVMEPDKITEWQWFDLHSLPSPLYSPSEKALKNYLAGQIYLH